jgi:hypothetical protein
MQWAEGWPDYTPDQHSPNREDEAVSRVKTQISRECDAVQSYGMTVHLFVLKAEPSDLVSLRFSVGCHSQIRENALSH